MEMNTDDLDWKHDAFTIEQHQSLNQQIMDMVEQYDLVSVPARQSYLARTLWNTYIDAQEADPSRVVPNKAGFTSILEATPGLRELLEEDIKQCDLSRTRSLLMFRDQQNPARSGSNIPQAAHAGANAEMTATVRSWEQEFSGRADSLLRQALEIWMKNPIGVPYARSLAIVQSSGTGKSRVNDELAKQIVYVPMLLSVRSNVFPPADAALASWILTGSPLPENRRQLWVARRMHMFLIALLKVTHSHLQALVSELALGESCPTEDATLKRLAQLATVFRKRLAEGRTWGAQGRYRTSFYEAVIKVADELIEEDPVTKETPVGVDTYESYTKSLGRRVMSAGDAVSRILNPSGHKVPQPLLMLLFDEAHSLIEDEGGCSRYNELRRALSSIRALPIFSIFLSTSASVIAADPSLRITSGLKILSPPFTETGYDELAIKVSTGGDWLLEHVASMEYMCHLGRPLFGSRYSCGNDEVKSMMIAFAAEKLIAKSPYPGLPLDPDATLACLSVLLGLEFRGTIWSREAERKQVERHMRLVIDGHPETMRTVSPSEPILAEGAHYVMQSRHAAALDSHFQNTYLSTGEHGEVVAALLIILARQVASSLPVVPTPSGGVPSATSKRHPMLKDPSDSNRRVLPLFHFLRKLLRPADFEKVHNSSPTQLRKGDDKLFRDIFDDSWVYFNHCIKASDLDVVNQKGLLRIISRGGILICANSMRAVDLIIPVTFKGTALRPDNITAVLIQVKNDRSFTDKMRTPLFAAMDPIDLGLFAGPSTALPVIRMVFALASPRPLVDIPAQGRRNKFSKYTAFDIWCAGCCDKTFKVISADENAAYQSLLNRTVDRSFTYEMGSQIEDKNITKFKERVLTSRRTMCPGAANDPAHWSRYMDEREDGGEVEGEGLMDTSE